MTTTVFGRGGRWFEAAVAGAAILGLVGLVGLPALAGVPESVTPHAAQVWLVEALVISLCLVGCLALSAWEVLRRLGAAGGPDRPAVVWTAVIVGVLVVQDILRPPLALVAAWALAAPSNNLDALLGAVTFLVLVGLLVRLYQAARPIVQDQARYLLNAVLPTTEGGTVDATARLRQTTSPGTTAVRLAASSRTAPEPTVRAGEILRDDRTVPAGETFREERTVVAPPEERAP